MYDIDFTDPNLMLDPNNGWYGKDQFFELEQNSQQPPPLMLDPNSGGYNTGDFLNDYLNVPPQPAPEDYQQWQIDAALEYANAILEDQRISDVLEAYKDIPEPPEHVTNIVVNQTSQWIAENVEAGAYDDIIDQYAEMSEMADAWEAANGFDDPFLDWGTFGETSFWRDDGMTWYGDEYGIY